ncbi:MAG: 3-keto-5-aminohexanoate cleavage protein, partial [Gammaproteobacteria bacterium]|nr:3-keto-5-aminohexanoate cleavage protein [Gammaproteobacteria bacterium]
MPFVAAAVLAGGNVRVGLEDNLYLGKGQLATNAQLVERAVTIIEAMGARVIGPDEVREKLKLTKRAPR